MPEAFPRRRFFGINMVRFKILNIQNTIRYQWFQRKMSVSVSAPKKPTSVPLISMITSTLWVHKLQSWRQQGEWGHIYCRKACLTTCVSGLTVMTRVWWSLSGTSGTPNHPKKTPLVFLHGAQVTQLHRVHASVNGSHALCAWWCCWWCVVRRARLWQA